MKKLFTAWMAFGLCFATYAGVSKVAGTSQNAPYSAAVWTNSFSGTAVQAGDVVVVQIVSNKKILATDFNINVTSGGGSVDGFTKLANTSASKSASYIFYTTATGNGSLAIEVYADGNSTARSAIYVLRADSGVISVADTLVTEDDSVGTLSLDYSFPAASGFLAESFSMLEAPSAGDPVLDTKVTEDKIKSDGTSRRVITGGGFSGESTLTTSWNISGATDTDRHGAVGVVFTEATGENRAPTFDSDPVVAAEISTNGIYSATLAGYATDLDGDPMTFWKQAGGPAWLDVASNGALTGTAPGTAGLNSWTIFVADDQGGTNNATLEINVIASEFADVPLTSSNLYVQGAKFVNIDGSGMNFHRFDSNLLSGATAENVNEVRAKTTSGVKLSFYTRSDTVKLSFDYIPGDENRNSRFGLYQNGVLVDSPYVSKSETNATVDVVLEITSQSAPGELVRHDVVLPNWSNPVLNRMELKIGEVVEVGNPYPAKKMVVLGDSISHGTGQGSSYETYPYIAAEALDVELFNMAVGGGKIAPEVADLLQDFEPVEAIWVLVGYNDWQGSSKTLSAITNDYENLLSVIRTHQPNAEVFCSTLIATTVVDDLESGVTAVEVRQGVSDVVNARIFAGDSQLHLVDGESISTTNDVINGVVHFTVEGASNVAMNVVAVMDPIVNAPKPNVLFIAIDDINPIMGCYGNSLIQTPNIDALAERGMLFENAHCQWAVCGPSRASLMTGLMPEQGGVMGFTKMRGDGVNNSRDNAKGMTNLVTIPQHFINQGYETAAAGKINDNRCVGSINSDGTINEDGGSVDDPPSWSYGFSNPGGVGSTTAYNPTLGKNLKLAAESVDQLATNFVDGAIATAGLVQLNALAAGSKPFFLGVGFKKPHLPFLAPKSSWDLYQHDDFTPHPFQTDMLNVTSYTFNNIKEMRGNYYLEKSGANAELITDGILPEDQQKTLQHGYYACISHVDEQVGRLLAELDTLGLTSNTIVVLWGDHGFHLGDHNEWGKHTNLEQATRVPFIISAPGYVPGKTPAPVGLLDIYPTLCELAGLPIPEQPLSESVSDGRPLSGHSLVPVLADPDARVQTGIMNHYGNNNYGYAYRTERYRYTEWITNSVNSAVAARELYDYETDPMETVNLAVYPEYEALMYQFSVASRSSNEAVGCDRLKSSAALPVPANKALPGLGISADEITWPDAAEASYNLMSKTNLTDAAWTTNQVALAYSPALIVQSEAQEFFRVEVAY